MAQPRGACPGSFGVAQHMLQRAQIHNTVFSCRLIQQPYGRLAELHAQPPSSAGGPLEEQEGGRATETQQLRVPGNRRKRQALKGTLGGETSDAPWSLGSQALTKQQWLQGAAQQPTTALLELLLAESGASALPEAARARLPVILVLLEQRPDLEQALLAAGLPRVARALLRSPGVLHVMPGGRLQLELARQLERQADQLSPEALLDAASLLAAWPAPAAQASSDAAAALCLAACRALATATRSSSTDQQLRRQAEACIALRALLALHPLLRRNEPGEAATSATRGALLALQQAGYLQEVLAADGLVQLLDALALYGVELEEDATRAIRSLAATASTSSSSASSRQGAAAAPPPDAVPAPIWRLTQLAGQPAVQASSLPLPDRVAAIQQLLPNTRELANAQLLKEALADLGAYAAYVTRANEAEPGAGPPAERRQAAEAAVRAVLEASAQQAQELPASVLLACLECAVQAGAGAGAVPEPLLRSTREALRSMEQREVCRAAAAALRLSCGGGSSPPLLSSLKDDAAAALGAAPSLEGVQAGEAVALLAADAGAAGLSKARAGGQGSYSSLGGGAAGLPAPLRMLLLDVVAAARGAEPPGAAAGLPAGECLAALALVTHIAAEAALSNSSTDQSLDPAASLVRVRAAHVALCQGLAAGCWQLSAQQTVEALRAVAAGARAGLDPEPSLQSQLAERLRAYAEGAALGTDELLSVLKSCAKLGWRPRLLLQPLLQPLLGVMAPADVPAGPQLLQPLQPAVAAQVMLQPDQLSSEQVKAALLAVAKLRLTGEVGKSLARRAVTALLMRRGAGDESALPSTDIPFLLWACASVRYRSAAALRVLLQLLLSAPTAALTARHVSQAVWAAARLGVGSDRLSRWAVGCCDEAALAAAAPQSLALLCWGLSKLGSRPPAQFTEQVLLAASHQWQRFKPQELSMLLFVVANWVGADAPAARLSPATASALDGAASHLLQQLHSFDVPALCSSCWALDRLGCTALGGAELGRVAAELQPRLGDPLASDSTLALFFTACANRGAQPKALLDGYVRQLPARLRRGPAPAPSGATAAAPGAYAGATPQELGETRGSQLWAVARSLALHSYALGWPGSGAGADSEHASELLHLLEQEAVRRSDALSGQHLAGIVHSFAKLGHCPKTWLRRGRLVPRLRATLPAMGLEQLSFVLWALSEWRDVLSTQPARVAQPAANGGSSNGASAEAFGAGLHIVLTPLQQACEARLNLLCRPFLEPPVQAPQADASAAVGPAAVAPAPLPQPPSATTVLRLLVGMARLRWRSVDAEALLLGWAERVVLERRGKVPELSTLLWSAGSLCLDAPELTEQVLRALIGLPPVPPDAAPDDEALAPPLPLQPLPAVAAVADAEPAAAPAAQPVAAIGSNEAQQQAPNAAPAAATAPAEPSEQPRAGTARQGQGQGGLLSKPARPPPLPAGPEATQAASPASAAAASSALSLWPAPAIGPPLPSEPWSAVDVSKVLWSCAKMNRPPGPHVLDAAMRSWERHYAKPGTAAAAASGGTAPRPSLADLCAVLWSLAVFRQHSSPFAALLASQLASALPAQVQAQGAALQGLAPHQALQLAACLLAAQGERVESPLAGSLSAAAKARLVEVWRSRVARRASSPPTWQQQDVVSVLKRMGYTAAANVVTPDGCTCIDVAIALPGPPYRLAVELVGPHNSAANSPRILGEAVLKYRLLQARAYPVIPLTCRDWDRFGREDVWTKMVYLQAKIDKRLSQLGMLQQQPQAAPGTASQVPVLVAAAVAAVGGDEEPAQQWQQPQQQEIVYMSAARSTPEGRGQGGPE